MRILIPLVALLLAAPAAGQTTPPAQPTAPPAKPSAPAPTTQPPKPTGGRGTSTKGQGQAAAAAAAARGLVLTLQVTSASGALLDGVHVTTNGPVTRDGETDQSGLVRFAGMKPGTYRVRLEKEGLVTFEREVTVPPRQSIAVDVTLNEAPAPPAPAPAPSAPAAPILGTPGEPRTLSLSDYIERNLIGGREPMKQSTVGCSGVLRSVLLQIREPLAEQTDDQLDQTLYVVAGQGNIKLAGRESPLGAATFAVIPRGTPFSLTRRGNTPLIVLLSRANEPCAAGGGGAPGR